MEINGHFYDILTKLLLSLMIGAVIGGEREYRNKSAGLRTMILICVGSCIFTIISFEASHSTEVGRIASNIVTGIGFLGAGAIMRDGLSISGMTTASSIWVVASLGLAIGVGEYQLAITATFLAMVVLVIFNYLQRLFDKFRRVIELQLIFQTENNGVKEFESKMNEVGISYERLKQFRTKDGIKFQYEISGNERKLNEVIKYLVDQKEKVKSFRY